MFGGVTPPTLAKREIRELVAGRGLAPALRLGPVSLRPVAGDAFRRHGKAATMQIAVRR